MFTKFIYEFSDYHGRNIMVFIEMLAKAFWSVKNRRARPAEGSRAHISTILNLISMHTCMLCIIPALHSPRRLNAHAREIVGALHVPNRKKKTVQNSL